MGMKVAIVGLATSSHDAAPWSDPAWQKWGLPWDDQSWTQLDRAFEMHDLRLLKSEHSTRKAGYFDRLRDCPSLYMQSASAEVPNAQPYPFEEVAHSVGQAYWNSSVAYALALAIHEGAQEIALYGIDMEGTDEYAYQRPNMEYLIGFARGKGIAVHIPESSALCKFQPQGIRFCGHSPTYVERYGWLG